METVRSRANQEYVSSLKFKTFNIAEDLKERPNFCMSITAKRNSGKSHLMRDLCSQIKDWYTNVYVFSMTAHLQPDLFDYVPEENIFQGFNEEKLKKLWDAQERQIQQLKKIGIEDPKKLPKILVLFDDIIGDPKVRNSQILNNFAIMGRHNMFATMIITQEMGGKAGLPKVVRANLDCAVCFFLNSEYDRKQFIDQYLSTKNTQIGNYIFDSITHKEYNALVVLNYVTDPEPVNYIRTYMASAKIKKFKMGSVKIKEARWIPTLADYKPNPPALDLKIKSRNTVNYRYD